MTVEPFTLFYIIIALAMFVVAEAETDREEAPVWLIILGATAWLVMIVVGAYMSHRKKYG